MIYKRGVYIFEYNGVTVTRIDKGNQIYLYYGKCDEKLTPCSQSYIMAEYSGFNSGMQAYLIFQDNSEVNIVDVIAFFKEIGGNSNLSLFEFEHNYEATIWIDGIQQNFNNTIELSDIIDYEKERNLKNHSKVKAVYQ